MSMFFCLFAVKSFAQQNFDYYEEYEKYAWGDSLQWKNLNYNDEGWDYYMDKKMEYKSPIVWLRIKVITNAVDIPPNQLGMIISLSGTYEVFWNGIKIGTNCRNGSNILENNGVLNKTLSFPDSLKIYKHNILAIRMSLPIGQSWDFSTLNINNRSDLSEVPTTDTIFLSLLLIIFSMLATYYMRSFKKDKIQWHYLFFSILLMLIAMNTAFEMISYLFPITYRSILLVDYIEIYLTVLLLFSFPLFFIVEFNFPSRYSAMIVSIIFIVSGYYYFDKAVYFQAIGMAPGILIILWALYKRKEGSINAIFGMFVFISILLSRNDISLMKLSFMVFPFFISISLSKQYFRQKKQFQLAKTQSARLENEMLRKIIQPHYLMNSLNAALEWIEEEPEKGVEFIQALSEEFRDFSRTSNLKLIPIKDEINMCRGHIEIMKFRQDKNYQLYEENIDYNKTIPPAIFHTTIENGITHEPQEAEETYFIIREEETKNGVLYRIICVYSPDKNFHLNIEPKSDILNKLIEQKESTDDGTGLAYIKARLTESYGSNWSITSNSYNLGWETVIKITN